MRLSAITAGLAFFATPIVAQQYLSTFCPAADICYSLNIPEETAKTGNGDIFFQISGPTGYSWIALGQGTDMIGANIFVMYADGNGNVTVSPRYATAYVQPLHNEVADITLLEGSGIAGNMMVANVKCSNCQKWNTGTADFTAATENWIFATRTGPEVNSDSLDATIYEHNNQGTFVWNLAKAKGGDSVNPFVTADFGPSDVSLPPSSNTAHGADSSYNVASVSQVYVTAHAVLASIAFLVFFPLGAIFIRVPALSKYGGWRLHAAIQVFGYSLFVVAAGLGIWIAKVQKQLADYHPVIGLVLLGLLFTQPFSGYLHHWVYLKKGGRTLISHGHIFLGRVLLILGIINGGLGIKFADDPDPGHAAAYGVVAGVMGLLYLLSIPYGEYKRSQNIKNAKTKAKEESSNEANASP